VLQLYRDDLLYSVWMFFEAGEFQNWYLNFEAPLVRHPAAIDTLDYGLDLVIASDGTTTWKEVEDLSPMLRTGRMTLSEIANVLEAAEQVSQSLSVGERWWSSWDNWRPTLVTQGRATVPRRIALRAVRARPFTADGSPHRIGGRTLHGRNLDQARRSTPFETDWSLGA